VEILFLALLTSVLDGGEWSASCSSHFTPGEIAPSTNWGGCWVGPIASLDVVAKKKSLLLLGV